MYLAQMDGNRPALIHILVTFQNVWDKVKIQGEKKKNPQMLFTEDQV